jgi:hypothetical protein
MEKQPQSRSSEKQPVQGAVKYSEDDYNFVDINPKTYDEALVTRFYNALMKVNFPMEDELEPLETWVARLEPKQSAEINRVHTQHVLIALKKEDKSQKDEEGKEVLPVIAGGLVYQYFKVGNVALFAYMVIDQAFRRRGLINMLIQRAITILHREARELGHPHCDLFIAETNGAGVEDGVMFSGDRHKVMHSLGFGHLDVAYVQPPLAEGKDPVYDLILIAHKDSPAISGPEGKRVVPVEGVMHHMREYARTAMWDPKKPSAFEDALYLKLALEQFKGVKTVAWNPNLPWPGPNKAPPGILKKPPFHPSQDAKDGKSQEASPDVSPAVKPVAASLPSATGPPLQAIVQPIVQPSFSEKISSSPSAPVSDSPPPSPEPEEQPATPATPASMPSRPPSMDGSPPKTPEPFSSPEVFAS